MTNEEIIDLKQMCQNMRKDCLIMAKAAGVHGFHFGASLSIIEIVAVLYQKILKIDTNALDQEQRDRFILSKGHGVPAVYAAWKELGILKEEELQTFKQNNTRLYGHPFRDIVSGVEFSSGSLGQGLSFGVGSALGMRWKGNQDSRVYVLIGDGECDEGSVWEAAMSAAKYQLNNLIAIVDWNRMQYDGSIEEVMPLASLEDKWKSFGWNVILVDGHEVEQIYDALTKESEMPLVIIAKTVKGKGISFMENNASWHHGIMKKQEEEQAWEEVSHIGL